jgi:hypothetical protein
MDKEAIVRRADTQEPSPPIAALLRDPYVLEFAGLAERPSYSEADLESALLDHLQAFSLSWVPDSVLRPDRSASHWVSIILCSDRDQTKVEFATAGLDNQLFVSRYLVALPSAEELREFIQRDREAIENSMREAHG